MPSRPGPGRPGPGPSGLVGRVAELTAPRTFVVREEPVPPPPAGRVLVRVEAVGICASDLTAWRRGPRDPAVPDRLGHEPVGTVRQLGAGVAGLRVGQRVTGRVAPAFADYVTADPADLVPVPDGTDPTLALGEPLGCVVEGYRRATPAVGARTAVIGLGFMGLVMTRLLALSPTAEVLGIDPRDDARAVAGTLGATRLGHPDDPDLPRSAAELVVEASGTAAGLRLATELAAEHGTLAVLGYHQTPREVALDVWNWKALDVVNAHVRDCRLLATASRRAMDLLASGRLDLSPLVTHRYPLDRVEEAYHALETKPAGFVKSVVTL